MAETDTYEVYMQVPNAHRSGTRGRLLAVRDSRTEVGDLVEYLVESLSHSGIPRVLALDWAKTHLDMRRVVVEKVMGLAESVPLEDA